MQAPRTVRSAAKESGVQAQNRRPQPTDLTARRMRAVPAVNRVPAPLALRQPAAAVRGYAPVGVSGRSATSPCARQAASVTQVRTDSPGLMQLYALITWHVKSELCVALAPSNQMCYSCLGGHSRPRLLGWARVPCSALPCASRRACARFGANAPGGRHGMISGIAWLSPGKDSQRLDAAGSYGRSRHERAAAVGQVSAQEGMI